MKYICKFLTKLFILFIITSITVFLFKIKIWHTFSSFSEIIVFSLLPIMVLKITFDLIEFAFAKSNKTEIKIKEFVNKENWTNYGLIDINQIKEILN